MSYTSVPITHTKTPSNQDDVTQSQTTHDAESLGKTLSLLLKCFQLIIGGIVISMILYHYDYINSQLFERSFGIHFHIPFDVASILFMLKVSTALFLCTCCLLVSDVYYFTKKSLMPPIFDFIYHVIGTFLLLTASALFYWIYSEQIIMRRARFQKDFDDDRIAPFKDVAILCVVNSAFYLAGAVQLRFLPFILKFVQLAIGNVCAAVIIFYLPSYPFPTLFYLLATTTFVIGTSCLLIIYIFSLLMSGTIPKTFYEIIYHTVAGCVLFMASIYMFSRFQYSAAGSVDPNRIFASDIHKAHSTVGALGVINSILYFWSAFLHKAAFGNI